MPPAQKKEVKMVKQETTFAIGFVGIMAGFLAGMMFAGGGSSQGPIQTTQAPAGMQQATTAQAPQASGTNMQQLKAIKTLEQMLGNNPADAGGWKRLGDLYFDTQNQIKAISAYRKFLEIKPDDASVWTDMGVMLLQNRQFEEAIAAFDKAIGIVPNHQQARFNKGILLTNHLKDHKGAVKVWEELLTINPKTMAPNGKPLKGMIDHLKGVIANN